MITALIGHRGVGKTSLLGRISHYLPGAITVDLDEIISQSIGCDITVFFAREGEASFRHVESKVWTQILEKYTSDSVWVAIGAGFEFQIPEHVRTIWIRRVTDTSGRIFFDRPRLQANVDPLIEYQLRFKDRDARFASCADEELFLREGFHFPNEAEKNWFTNKISQLGGALTLTSPLLSTGARFKKWILRRQCWGIKWFEIRTDLLTLNQAQEVLRWIPGSKIMLSFRGDRTARFYEWCDLIKRHQIGLIDWPIELQSIHEDESKKIEPLLGLGTDNGAVGLLLSCHDRILDLNATLRHLIDWQTWGSERIVNCFRGIKFSPLVDSLTELMQVHAWVQKDKTNRFFLPRSFNGRWNWYRLLNKFDSALQFFREGSGSSLDQPLLLDWFNYRSPTDQFAAVLGSPVFHSWTPAEHSAFFSPMPVVAIEVSEEEFDSELLENLFSLGMRFSAVTSPLKKRAFELSRPINQNRDGKFRSANTLLWSESNSCWIGAMTDPMGLIELLAPFAGRSLAIWGGGGTLSALEEVCVQFKCRVKFFSARSGKERGLSQSTQWKNPEVVVWAAPKSRVGQRLVGPPEEWTPEWVIDLSYAENSIGKEYALAVRAKYESGIKMFRAQAEGQRRLWSFCGGARANCLPQLTCAD